MTLKTSLFPALLLIALWGWCEVTPAQEPPPAETEQNLIDDRPLQVEDETRDPLNRETPLSSMSGFVAAADAFDWERAAQYLDLRNLPPGVRRMDGASLAEQFYFILQRRQVEINADLISNRSEGQAIDDLPDYRDELGRVEVGEEVFVLLLQRVPGPDGELIWKVSNATVAQIPALYDAFRLPDWVEKVRGAVPSDRAFLGVEAFKWVILLVEAAILIPVGWVFFYGIARLVSRPGAPLWKEIKGILTGPVLALTVISFLGVTLLDLGMGATATKIMNTHTLTTVFTIWLIWKGVDIWRARRRLRYEEEGRGDAAVLGRPVANAVKLVTLLLGIVIWLANAGVDVTALLAGLGVGGIAVALALQKPIEDLFGAVSIYSQQPVNTGDLCRYGNEVGKVEEIGLRTTRIRTLANTLVSVPNATFSTGLIENLAARTKIMYHPDLHVRCDTSREQIQAVLAEFRQMFIDNPRIENDTIRVRLAEFKPDAIVIRLRVFASTTDFEEYLEIVEQVNLDIMRILAENGVRFSQRAQSLFIEEGSAGALTRADARTAS